MDAPKITTIVAVAGQGGIEKVCQTNYDSRIEYLSKPEARPILKSQYGILFRLWRVMAICRTSDVVVTNLPVHHVVLSVITKIMGTKHLAVEHGPWVLALAQKSGWFVGSLYQLWLKISSTQFVCVGQDLCAMYNLMRRNNVYIPNTVPGVSASERKADLFNDEGVLRLVFLGRLDDQKNIGLLIDAIHAINRSNLSFTLDIFGDGPQRYLIEDLASDIEVVEFKGFVSHAGNMLVNYDALILTSLYEGLPGVVLEALSIGLKVFTVPFVSGLFELSQSRLVSVCEQQTSDSLAHLICTEGIESNDVETVDRFSLERYSIENVKKAYTNVFSSL